MRKLTGKRRWFLRFYVANDCKINKTCRALGISRMTAFSWLRKYPALKAQVREAKKNRIPRVKSPEELEDERISRLVKRMRRGDTPATIKLLTIFGRDRGWKPPGKEFRELFDENDEDLF